MKSKPFGKTALAFAALFGASVLSTNASAGIFAIDQFTVTKNSLPFFSDDFSSGGPPPSAPDFASGTPASYSASGAGFSETGGRVYMDNSLGIATIFNSDILRGNFALLLSNRQEQGTGSGQSNLGLKENSSFNVTGVYDLGIPAEPREAYGIRVTDRDTGTVAPQPGNDSIELVVIRGLDGNLRVALRDIDFAAMVITNLDSVLLSPGSGDAQIALNLHHDANTTAISGSFSLLDSSGGVNSSYSFSNTGSIYSDETWTRAMFMTWSPAPEPGSMALLGLGLFGLGWGRRRKA